MRFTDEEIADWKTRLVGAVGLSSEAADDFIEAARGPLEVQAKADGTSVAEAIGQYHHAIEQLRRARVPPDVS